MKSINISHQVIKIILLIGVLSALLSCITGYVLSTTDNYEKPLVVWHMWMGIGVAVASMFLYMKVARSEFDIIYKILAVGLFDFNHCYRTFRWFINTWQRLYFFQF